MNLNAFTLPAARSITVLATKDNGNKNEVRRGTVAGLRDAGLSGDRRKRHAPSMTRLGMRPAVRLHELAYYTTSTIEGTSLAGTRISNLSGWRSSNTFFFFFPICRYHTEVRPEPTPWSDGADQGAPKVRRHGAFRF